MFVFENAKQIDNWYACPMSGQIWERSLHTTRERRKVWRPGGWRWHSLPISPRRFNQPSESKPNQPSESSPVSSFRSSRSRCSAVMSGLPNPWADMVWKCIDSSFEDLPVMGWCEISSPRSILHCPFPHVQYTENLHICNMCLSTAQN